MIYFLVHNNLHYIWAESIRQAIQKEDHQIPFVLIKFVPSALTMADHDGHYQRIWQTQGLFGGFWQLLDIPKQKEIKKRLDAIRFEKNDLVFVFTEYEIATHYIIKNVKDSGGRVFIMDEGIGTYIINNYSILSQGRSIKQRLIHYAIKYINGFHHTQRLTGNQTLYFPRLEDRFYDGYLLFYQFPFRRRMPLFRVSFPEPKKEIPGLVEQSVLILGQGLQDYYLTVKEYLASLRSIIEVSVKSFRHVYFKFHHCELPFLKTQPFGIFINFLNSQGVKIIDFDRPVYVENIVPQLDFPPKFVVSHFCTALLNLFARGCEPIFTCHLLKDRNTDFAVIQRLLERVHYRFISSYDDINPAYRSGLTYEDVFSSQEDIGSWYRHIAYAQS